MYCMKFDTWSSKEVGGLAYCMVENVKKYITVYMTVASSVMTLLTQSELRRRGCTGATSD